MVSESPRIPRRYTPPAGPDRFARSQWFRRARLGMFIHWGVYSLLGRGEWVRSHEEMTAQDYLPWAKAFNPESVDFHEWARLAKEAGMEYAILTAKHHDGYCLFDSAHSDFTSAKMTPGRDFVAEFLEAFRAEGLRVGLYFSLIDWADPDYPVWGDAFHPQRNDPAFRGVRHDFDAYLTKMHAQVKELCTNYGALDILWFDFSYDEMTGERWRARELVEMVRSLQPQVLIDNRLEVSASAFGSIVTAEPSPFAGDFVSPEQLIPPSGILGEDGAPVPWESCGTLNNHWAWHHSDTAMKAPSTLAAKLVEIVSKGGNLLLNVGPDGQGRIPAESAETLRAFGAWVHAHEEALKGAGPAGIDKPEWGRWTMRGSHLYAHVWEEPIGPLPLVGVRPQDIESVRLIGGDGHVHVAKSWVIEAYPDVAFLSFAPPGQDDAFTFPLPQGRGTVIDIALRESGGTEEEEEDSHE